MNQHDFVKQAQTRYNELHLQPGNPDDGDWEKAHYPTPKCLGGTEWVWLNHIDHQVQGVLQAKEFKRCCYFEHAVRTLLRTTFTDAWFDLWDILEATPHPTQGFKHSAASIRKMREKSRKGCKHTEEAKRKISLATSRPRNITTESALSRQQKTKDAQKRCWISLLTGRVSSQTATTRTNRNLGGDGSEKVILSDELIDLMAINIPPLMTAQDRIEAAINLNIIQNHLLLQ